MELALSNRHKAGLFAGAAGLFCLVSARHAVAPQRASIDSYVAGAVAASRGFAEPAPQAAGLERRMIREGTMTLEVAARGEARGRALEAARRLGADILNDEASEGDGSGAAAMTFAIEPARLGQLVEALSPLGRVLSRVSSAQDVTEEWVDLDARLANARAVRSRLEELLRFKTSKLADVVLVERELERVGSELEQMEGRRKYLAARTERARLCVRFQEKPKMVSSFAGFETALRGGFGSAFGVFAATSLALLQLAGFVLGLALWTVPASLLGWKAWKRWG
jgi:hypothetical protein